MIAAFGWVESCAGNRDGESLIGKATWRAAALGNADGWGWGLGRRRCGARRRRWFAPRGGAEPRAVPEVLHGRCAKGGAWVWSWVWCA